MGEVDLVSTPKGAFFLLHMYMSKMHSVSLLRFLLRNQELFISQISVYSLLPMDTIESAIREYVRVWALRFL